MIRRVPARSLRRDQRGVTLVEFAMISPALCLVLIGILDLGYRAYVGSIVQGALHEAARMATVGGVTQAQIDARVQGRLQAFSRNATITTNQMSYAEFTDVRLPERLVVDTPPLGVYNQGDCFEDANGNGTYDLDRGRGGTGGADDVVLYEVTMTYPRLLPMAGLLGWSEDVTINSSTVLRNQPFAARSTGTTIICWE
jgi:Flp pilus assembly protein TadG